MARLSKERKEEIRQLILDTSKVMFMEDGYDKTSTSKIAKAVGIAEGTIFNYFDTKADIFLEVMASDFIPMSNFEVMNFENCISDILYDFLYSSFKTVVSIPKKVLREVGAATLAIAKKKPTLIRNLAELDYKLLGNLQLLIDDLQEKGLLIACESKLAAESIYGSLIFEIGIYVYEDDYLKEEMLNNIRKKIEFIMKAYVPV